MPPSHRRKRLNRTALEHQEPGPARGAGHGWAQAVDIAAIDGKLLRSPARGQLLGKGVKPGQGPGDQ